MIEDPEILPASAKVFPKNRRGKPTPTRKDHSSFLENALVFFRYCEATGRLPPNKYEMIAKDEYRLRNPGMVGRPREFDGTLAAEMPPDWEI